MDGGTRTAKKRTWGTLRAAWVPHDTRDAVMDFVSRWSERAEIPASRFVRWLGIGASKFYDWKQRYGKVNEHNAWVPRDFWLAEWEKEAIVEFHGRYPLEGYRRLSFMMMDADIWYTLVPAAYIGFWPAVGCCSAGIAPPPRKAGALSNPRPIK